MTPEKTTIHKLSLYTLSLKQLIEYLQFYPHKLRDLNFFKWRNEMKKETMAILLTANHNLP